MPKNQKHSLPTDNYRKKLGKHQDALSKKDREETRTSKVRKNERKESFLYEILLLSAIALALSASIYFIFLYYSVEKTESSISVERAQRDLI